MPHGKLHTKTIALMMMSMLMRESDLYAMQYQPWNTMERKVEFIGVQDLKNQGRLTIRPLFMESVGEDDNILCPVRSFRAYCYRAERHVDSVRIFVDLCSSHKDLSSERFDNLVTHFLHDAGIDHHFTCHSLRMATASKLIKLGVPVEEVMVLGRWRSKSVFRKFYNRALLKRNMLNMLASLFKEPARTVNK